MTNIGINGTTVTIDGLEVDDGVLAELLGSQPDERQAELARRVLEVGARGLLTMGLGIDLAEVDARVRRSVDEVTGEARQHVEQVLAAARQAFGEHFDPDLRSSMVGRALDEFTQWRDGFLRSFNPDFVFSDSRLSSLAAAKLLGIPSVTVLNTYKVTIPRERRFLTLAQIADGGILTIIGESWALGKKILIPDFFLCMFGFSNKS